MTLPPGEKERGRINGLAAYIGGDWEVAGIKWIPGFPNNPSRYKLPRANAFMILNDTNTGMPQAIMDGTLLSAMRTGAIGGGVDVVIHAAGQPGVPSSVRMPKEDFSINAFGTLNVLEAARKKSKDTIVIYCSTNKVYGENVDKIPLKRIRKERSIL
jgi:nucleoside-diphosphate-sugar epimerase